MKPIVRVPHKVLSTPAQPITSFDEKLTSLVREMKKTLLATKNPEGVGLAAPQIGEPYRVFITKPRENSAIRVFINPEITGASKELTEGVPERDNKLEGCLSIPGVWGRVKRAARVSLRYQDKTGMPHEEHFEGFLATVIQHETDHINGILYTQRALTQNGKLFQSVKDDEGKEILEELSLP